MVSDILTLSFFLSSVRRRMKYKKSRPQQKTLPTALSKTILLSSDAAVAMAPWISFITSEGKQSRNYDNSPSGAGSAICEGCGLTSGLSVLFSELLVDSRMWVNPSCFFTTMSL